MAVVNHSSMVEAAAALGYVPSAVSQHIAALEREMNIELLVRRPGSRLILTAAGRSLVKAAETLFSATARFQDAANGISNREIAELHVGTYSSAMSHLLPEVLSALKSQGPGPRIRLVDVETPEGLSQLKSGNLDLLIAYRYLPEDPPAATDEWNITSLGKEALVVVSGKQLGRPLELEECLEMEWISGYTHNADRRLLHRWSGELGIRPNVKLETQNLHSMLAMIRAGLAVGMIPATLVSGESGQSGIERVVLPSTVVPLYRDVLAVSRAGTHPPIVDELVKLLTAALKSAQSQ